MSHWPLTFLPQHAISYMSYNAHTCYSPAATKVAIKDLIKRLSNLNLYFMLFEYLINNGSISKAGAWLNGKLTAFALPKSLPSQSTLLVKSIAQVRLALDAT